MMTRDPSTTSNPATRGYGFLAAMIAGIVVAVAFAASIGLTQRNTTRSTELTQLSARIANQAQTIRQKILECALDYPDGGPSSSLPYKQFPPSTLTSGDSIEDLMCPGTGKTIWHARDGTFIVPDLPNLSGWRYINNTDGVRIFNCVAPSCASPGTSQFAIKSLSYAAREFGVMETRDGSPSPAGPAAGTSRSPTSPVFTLWLVTPLNGFCQKKLISGSDPIQSPDHHTRTPPRHHD